jgi:threonine dehydrogenase-like Zn-dependent dehydrogenase
VAASVSPPSRTSRRRSTSRSSCENNIFLYGIRGEGKSATHRAAALMSQKRFDATKIHTHTFGLDDLPTALRYAGQHIDDAIKVVVTVRNAEAERMSVADPSDGGGS